MQLFLLATCVCLAAGERTDLSGIIVDASQRPVAGATVFVYTASVRSGTSALCPSCYPDCAKKSRTGDDGRFRIASLDPELLFHLLIVADGYEPKFADGTDPATEPVTIALVKRDATQLVSERTIHGQVIDDQGHPVVGARVVPKWFKVTGWEGASPRFFEPLAVSNERGEFTITANQDIEYVKFVVSARGLASAATPKWTPRESVHVIRLNSGAFISGVVLHDGRPAPGTVLGLVQIDRSSDGFLGDMKIATDEKGRFMFSNVAPELSYYLYGKMESLRPHGAIPWKMIRAPGDGSTMDVGTIQVKPGHQLTGRVVLSDGSQLPAVARILLSRSEAWDSQSEVVDADGRFTLRGIPSEVFNLTLRLPGYRVSAKNASFDPLNLNCLRGLIDGDLDVMMLFEPGEIDHESAEKEPWEDRSRRFSELRKQRLAGVSDSR